MPNDPYMGRTAPLTSKRCILYIYSTNIGTEYFKRALYSPFFPLQNAVCFTMLTCLVPVLFTFYLQGVLKLRKNNSGAKGLITQKAIAQIIVFSPSTTTAVLMAHIPYKIPATLSIHIVPLTSSASTCTQFRLLAGSTALHRRASTREPTSRQLSEHHLH